jgi:hypothetical protein
MREPSTGTSAASRKPPRPSITRPLTNRTDPALVE